MPLLLSRNRTPLSTAVYKHVSLPSDIAKQALGSRPDCPEGGGRNLDSIPRAIGRNSAITKPPYSRPKKPMLLGVFCLRLGNCHSVFRTSDLIAPPHLPLLSRSNQPTSITLTRTSSELLAASCGIPHQSDGGIPLFAFSYREIV